MRIEPNTPGKRNIKARSRNKNNPDIELSIFQLIPDIAAIILLTTLA